MGAKELFVVENVAIPRLQPSQLRLHRPPDLKSMQSERCLCSVSRRLFRFKSEKEIHDSAEESDCFLAA
jgi:hypothetical protein